MTAIRAADTDGNPDTAPEAAWTSFLGTPPFPSYVSGHSGHSARPRRCWRTYFETDAVPFTLSTDSLPGVTRSYESFSAAAHEVSDSRVFAGIHSGASTSRPGRPSGTEVGNYVATNWLLPVRRHDDGAAQFPAGVARHPSVPRPVGYPCRGDLGLRASVPARLTPRTPRCSARSNAPRGDSPMHEPPHAPGISA